MFKRTPASATSISARKPVYGIAKNDSEYKTHIFIDGKKYRCPYYSVWHDMIRRCFSSSFKIKNPTYKNCSVCEEWLTFSNFKSWMESQEWEGKQLDKDIIEPGNKEYSPDKCAFISSSMNCLFNVSKHRPGKMLGVYASSSGNRFKAYMRTSCKSNFLGSFETEDEAAVSYLMAKIEFAKKLSKEELNQDVVNGVFLRISDMESEIKRILGDDNG